MGYTIKEVAEKLSITTHTLRYYEKVGLLPDISRNNAGNRVYTESDISWIYLICRLRDINMPVQYISEYVLLLKDPKSSVADRRLLVESFQQEINETLKKYNLVSKLISKKLEFYDVMENSEKNESELCYDYQADWEHFMTILREDGNE